MVAELANWARADSLPVSGRGAPLQQLIRTVQDASLEGGVDAGAQGAGDATQHLGKRLVAVVKALLDARGPHGRR